MLRPRLSRIRRTMAASGACLASLLFVESAIAVERFVNPISGSNIADGLCAEPQGGGCGPMLTIRAAMDAAVNGDTITLADGVYSGDGNQALWFNGKRLTIRSANGPANCVIDPELAQRVFRLEHGETRETVIEGITIRRAKAIFVPLPGGAIRIVGASPTIRNCVFLECEGNSSGGAIHARDSEALIENCQFVNCVNNAVFVRDGAVTMRDCRITGVNNSTLPALHVQDGNPELSDCVLENCANHTNEDGVAEFINVAIRNCSFLNNDGAIRLDGATLEDCVVDNSQHDNPDTGVYAVSGTLRRTRVAGSRDGVVGPCNIVDSLVENHDRAGVTNATLISGSKIRACQTGSIYSIGGTFQIQDSSIEECSQLGVRALATTNVQIRQSRLRANLGTQSDPGAAITIESGANVALWNTIIDSQNKLDSTQPPTDGGAVYVESGATLTADHCAFVRNAAEGRGGALSIEGAATITNTIFHRNSAWPGSQNAWVAHGGSLTLRYCSFDPGTPGLDAEPGATLVLGPGVIEGEPDFAERSFRLAATSALRDAGDPAPEGLSADMDGEARVANGRRDIGPDEFHDLDNDSLPDKWERDYFDSITRCESNADDDEDGSDNLLEFLTGRDPNRAPRTYYVDVAGDDSLDGLSQAPDGHGGGPKRTIQAAINACSSVENDIVQVAPGTYDGSGNSNVLISDRGVTIRSENPLDAAVVAATILRSGTDQFSLIIEGTTHPAVQLSGMTFVRDAASGLHNGAVSAHLARLRMDHCSAVCGPFQQAVTGTQSDLVMEDCEFPSSPGGGIWLQIGNLEVARCTFDHVNDEPIFHIRGESLVARDCIFEWCGDTVWSTVRATQVNNVLVYGSRLTSSCGIGLEGNNQLSWPIELGPTLQVSNCRFEGTNTCGAVALTRQSGKLVVEDCEFDNISVCKGMVYAERPSDTVIRRSSFISTSGGCFTGDSMINLRTAATEIAGHSLLEDCYFYDIASHVIGGNPQMRVVNSRFEAMRSSSGQIVVGPAHLLGCEIVTSTRTGPLMRNTSSFPLVLDFCSIAANRTAAIAGGIIDLGASSQGIIRNSIISHSIGRPIPPTISVGAGGSISVENSFLRGGMASIALGAGATVNWDDRNSADDPRFVESAAGDVRLAAGSPAADAGDAALSDLTPADIGGCPRVADDDGDDVPVVNIGSREARAITVDDDGPAQFSSIQAAIDSMESYCDTVISVLPGMYHESLHISDSVQIVSTSGPAETHVIGDASGPVVRVDGGQPYLNGLTFSSGSAAIGGAMLVENGATVLARSCVFTDSTAEDGSAIAVVGGGLSLQNCLAHGNTSSNGTAILFDHANKAEVVHCTIARNHSGSSIGGLRSIDSPIQFRNSIVYFNSDVEATESFDVTGVTSGGIRYSCIQGTWPVATSLKNRFSDPEFRDFDAGDFRLKFSSRCIDAGDIQLTPMVLARDLAGEPRRVDEPLKSNVVLMTPSVDMGAYESACAADIDENYVVDLVDLAVVLANFGTPNAATREAGDIDADGDVDLVDLAFMLTSFGAVCE